MKSQPNVKEFKVYERDENGLIMYSYSKMPKLMTDRDVLLEMKRVNKSDGKRVVVLRSIERDDLEP